VEVDKIRRWIAQGADWPAHWAYRTLFKPEPPGPAARWMGPAIRSTGFFSISSPRGLAPAGPHRLTLLRASRSNLTGLLPTAAEIADFLADRSPVAYERVVERLLASPAPRASGWARHWMDVAHFAETHGHDQDRRRENAWPYRDYLDLRTFNQDTLPRFVQEQVAGRHPLSG